MRIFITGCKGQLGRALYKALAHHTLAGCDLPELDITDRLAIRGAIRGFEPDVVIHAAAWTHVDGCARDPELAYCVNAIGTQYVALACQASDAAMVYISTNEVFAGQSDEPYREWAPLHPINPYGRSKAAGEWVVRNLLNRFTIVRTAWLYAPDGKNFPHRIIELADEVLAGERSDLRVVTDEISNPTYAPDLAEALDALITTEAYGVYHLVNEGFCSRHTFAQAILERSGRGEVPVAPIISAEFHRASTPPLFAPLANTAGQALGIHLRRWEDALDDFLSQREA